MPKVSFILPAYKRRFLHEAIASILAQTYRDFELVVVDDCSPEDLKSVVDEFHDERLTYQRNAENIGGKDLVAAWNHAMEYARGEWCVLASDDDVYLPRFLEELLKLHEKYPACDLFHARNVDIDRDGKLTDVWFARPEFESQIEVAYARAVLRFQQRISDFMFRYVTLKKIGGFVNFPVAWYSDDATSILLSRNGCAHSREPLFCFRNSGENLSSSRDDLVEKKICAGRQYLVWMGEFPKAAVPRDDIEKMMVDTLLKRVEINVRTLEGVLINAVKEFKTWWYLVDVFSLTNVAKREYVYNRFPKLRALRVLLPHFASFK